jgi:metal-sulfur cluster biosynthetic enzyme
MVTKDTIVETLKECYDPEIPINIVDLGLIYDIAIVKGNVSVKMTLTARGCPMSAFYR